MLVSGTNLSLVSARYQKQQYAASFQIIPVLKEPCW